MYIVKKPHRSIIIIFLVTISPNPETATITKRTLSEKQMKK